MADDTLETVSESDRQLAKLAKELAEDPKTRKSFLKLIKDKNPNQVIPELDTEAAIQTFAKPYLDQLATLQKERLADKVELQIEKRRMELRGQGFNDDDVKAIEELMVKEQIPNYNTAAKFYKHERTAAAPTPAMTSLVNKSPVDKKAMKDAGGIKNWARGEAGKAIDDLKAGRVKLH